MSAVDSAIEDVGSPAVIQRSPTNVSTYMYIYPKEKGGNSNEREALLPTTSGVVSGDLILVSGTYYLVRSVLEDRRVDTFFLYRVKLLMCNNTITIRSFDTATKAFIDASTGIPCAIIDSGSAAALSDRSITVPGARGTDSTYQLFAQSSNGIDKNSAFVDANNVALGVTEVNVYFASGLIEATVKVTS